MDMDRVHYRGRASVRMGLQDAPEFDFTKDRASESCQSEMAKLAPEDRGASLHKTIRQANIVQAVGAGLLAIGASIVAYHVHADIEPSALIQMGTMALIAAGALPALKAMGAKAAANEYLRENIDNPAINNTEGKAPEIKSTSDVAKNIFAMREKSFSNNKDNKLTI